MPVHAATDAEVNALRDEVKELKQLVQKLSIRQKTTLSVSAPAPPPTPAAPPLLLRKPGWMAMADGQTQVKTLMVVSAQMQPMTLKVQMVAFQMALTPLK